MCTVEGCLEGRGGICVNGPKIKNKSESLMKIAGANPPSEIAQSALSNYLSFLSGLAQSGCVGANMLYQEIMRQAATSLPPE